MLPLGPPHAAPQHATLRLSGVAKYNSTAGQGRPHPGTQAQHRLQRAQILWERERRAFGSKELLLQGLKALKAFQLLTRAAEWKSQKAKWWKEMGSKRGAAWVDAREERTAGRQAGRAGQCPRAQAGAPERRWLFLQGEPHRAALSMPRPRPPHSTVGMDACGGHWAAPSGSRSSAGGGGRKEGKPLLRDVSPAAQRGLVTFAIIFLICIPTSSALGSLLPSPAACSARTSLPCLYLPRAVHHATGLLRQPCCLMQEKKQKYPQSNFSLPSIAAYTFRRHGEMKLKNDLQAIAERWMLTAARRGAVPC